MVSGIWRASYSVIPTMFACVRMKGFQVYISISFLKTTHILFGQTATQYPASVKGVSLFSSISFRIFHFILIGALRSTMYSDGLRLSSRAMESFWIYTVATFGRILRRASSTDMSSQAISVIAPSPRMIESPLTVYVPDIELQFVRIKYVLSSKTIY